MLCLKLSPSSVPHFAGAGLGSMLNSPGMQTVMRQMMENPQLMSSMMNAPITQNMFQVGFGHVLPQTSCSCRYSATNGFLHCSGYLKQELHSNTQLASKVQLEICSMHLKLMDTQKNCPTTILALQLPLCLDLVYHDSRILLRRCLGTIRYEL